MDPEKPQISVDKCVHNPENTTDPVSDTNQQVILSDVVAHLDPEACARYKNKIKVTGNTDPYLIPIHRFVSLLSSKELPNIQYPDIYNYLINSTSSYTNEQLKAYKGLDGYKYFVAGWVRSLLITKTNGVFVITGKVSRVSVNM